MIFVNKKNKKKYRVCGECINTTNKDEGEIMVIYYLDGDDSKIFVRNKTEFFEKFDCAK